MQAVQQFTNLRMLELGSNKIREMTGLEGLTNLQELWLGRNRIADISGLNRCSTKPQSFASTTDSTGLMEHTLREDLPLKQAMSATTLVALVCMAKARRCLFNYRINQVSYGN